MTEPRDTATRQDAEFGERILGRQRFFSKPVPPGYAEEWASTLAAVPEKEEKRDSVLHFQIAGLTLGVATAWVKAVMPLLAVCPVPHRDNTAFLGLVAFQGAIFPCCSLARILGVADAVSGAEARTIVLKERPGEWWAFPVDRVEGIANRGAALPAELETERRVPAEWLEAAYETPGGSAVQLLRPSVLMERLKRATA